jgi:hypothetical protein
MKPSVALTTALSGAYLARAIVVMIIVGSVLNLINQGEALFQGAPLNFAKLRHEHQLSLRETPRGTSRYFNAISE